MYHQPRPIRDHPTASPRLGSARGLWRRALAGICLGLAYSWAGTQRAWAATTSPTLPPLNITPNPGGLPGTSTLIHMLGGLQFDAMLAAIAGVIIGAGVWAVSAHSNNYQGSSRGRTAVLASALAALVIGFGPALVHSLFNTGAAAQ